MAWNGGSDDVMKAGVGVCVDKILEKRIIIEIFFERYIKILHKVFMVYLELRQRMHKC